MPFQFSTTTPVAGDTFSYNGLTYRHNGRFWAVAGANASGSIIPAGGTTGQVLAKSSGTDYALIWTTPSGGGTIWISDTAPDPNVHKRWITLAFDEFVWDATSSTWVQLGGLGVDGREIELQTASSMLQWRYVGVPTWTDLFDLSTLGGGGSSSKKPYLWA
jgi:hypothetical protein